MVRYIEVLLKDPEAYLSDGRMIVPPGTLEWDRVEYRDPETCSCSINNLLIVAGLVPHDGSEEAWARQHSFIDRESLHLSVDGLGSTMCRDCRDSWGIDYVIRGSFDLI